MVTTSDGELVNSMTRAHIMFKLSSRRIGFHGLRALRNTSDVVMFFLYNVAHAAKPMSPKIAFFFFSSFRGRQMELCATNKGCSDSNKGCSSRKGILSATKE